MTVIWKIQANLDRMPPATRRIGEFIIKNPQKMLDLSTSELAAAIGCSQSGVVKFSQRLGFSNYQDFKLAINASRADNWQLPGSAIHGTIEQSDSFTTIFEKLINSKMLAMRQTSGANGGREVARAVTAMLEAHRIYLVGAGASSLVASDLAFKLLKIGLPVVHSGDAHVQLANVAGMTAKDVLLAVSYSGSSIDTVRIAERARLRKGTIVAITGLRDNPLARVADVKLYTVADEEQARSSSITARNSQLALTDLLFLMIVQAQPDAQQFIHDSEAAVEALKEH